MRKCLREWRRNGMPLAFLVRPVSIDDIRVDVAAINASCKHTVSPSNGLETVNIDLHYPIEPFSVSFWGQWEEI